MAKRKFKVILIKPSHYDADGYVIQWWRSLVPSNSLASVYGLLAECAEREVLGPDVDIEIEAYDECNTIIDVKGAIAQDPRAPAPASSVWSACSRTSFRARSISPASSAPPALPVVIGGFHVSGCISMLPELPADLQGGARSRHHPVRRRGRRPHGRRCCATSTPARPSRSTIT